jgi:site-specific recombinase XerD
LLADTGMRATELCNIQMKDVNLNNHSVKIVGKGNKERIVFFGKRTSKALRWCRTNSGTLILLGPTWKMARAWSFSS